MSVGTSPRYVFTATGCGASSTLAAISRADGSVLWHRDVAGLAVIDPRDPYGVLVYREPADPLPEPAGGRLEASRLAITPSGLCRATATRIGCLNGKTGDWDWAADLPAGSRVVGGDRTVLAYRLEGSAARITVFQIADGTPTLRDRRVAEPPIADAAGLRILYTQGVLVVGDDRRYALYAGPVTP